MQIDEMKPNSYSDAQKLRWISQLDGRIALRLMHLAPEEVKETFTYHYPEDLETVPLVDPPDDEMYQAWLAAKIDEADHETPLYRNSAETFNTLYTDFAVWFLNTYDPIQEG